jgi:hypothetical protein
MVNIGFVNCGSPSSPLVDITIPAGVVVIHPSTYMYDMTYTPAHVAFNSAGSEPVLAIKVPPYLRSRNQPTDYPPKYRMAPDLAMFFTICFVPQPLLIPPLGLLQFTLSVALPTTHTPKISIWIWWGLTFASSHT